MYVYKITNKINDKIYIGQTTRSIEQRWKEHCRDYSCRALANAIKKYGKENFTISILQKCSSIDELNKKEQYYITQLKTLSPFGYNLNTGGCNYKISPELRSELSKNQLKRFKNPEELEKLSKRALKMWKNPKYRNKMIERLKRRALDKEYRRKVAKINGGKPFKVYKIIQSIGSKSSLKVIKVKYVGEWYCQSICGEDLGLQSKSITACLNKDNTRRRQIRGYIFKYSSDNQSILDIVNRPIVRKGDREFSVYTIDGIFIQNFTSKKYCGEYLGINAKGISNCLNGYNKSYKGYLFNYIDK